MRAYCAAKAVFATTRKAMAEASHDVLDGFEIETEVSTVVRCLPDTETPMASSYGGR